MFDDENIDKMWQHGILQEQVRQVLDSRPAIVVNGRERRGLYVITGRDNGERASQFRSSRRQTRWSGGRSLHVPCKESEEARLR